MIIGTADGMAMARGGRGNDLAFLAGGGEMGALMRAKDWSKTSLGPPARWPQSLRTAIRILLNTRHPMFIFWGPEGVCFYNDAFRRSLGPEGHPGALGKPAREAAAEIWDIVGPQVEQVMAGGAGAWRENQLVRIPRDGAFEGAGWTCSYSPIDDEQAPDGVGGVLVAANETITAEKAAQDELARAQEQLRQAQKMEAVGQLTGGLAHDFNNLMTIIRSSTDFLRRRDLSEERRRRYVDAISDTVDRAAKLTSQILAFARRQPLVPEVFEINHRLESVAALVRPLAGAGVEIRLELSEQPRFVNADVAQFETTLLNLAANGRDAMLGEGVLTFRVEAVGEIPAAPTQPGREGAFVAISVTDTGCGIPANNLEAVFEPFFTTKEVGKGTGLGLSQSFAFAKQSGGEIRVVSGPDRGASVTLYLPETTAVEGAQTAVAPCGEAGPAHGESILVVEDDEDVGRFSTEMLHDLGYTTRWAASAQEALALLAEDDFAFDLVFSDVIMPGMNGVELAEVVRRTYPGLPVVLTSGYSHVLAENGDHGFELIGKPYSVEALSRVLRRTVADRSSVRRSAQADAPHR